MFKFLRQYQKHILAVGVTVLMIAFLIQPTISMFQPDPVKRPIGSIGGEDWTIRDKRTARAQLAILERLGIPLTQVRDRDDAALQWLLIMHEAGEVGLWASDSEVNDLLRQMGRTDAHVAQIARDFGATRDFILETVRGWVVTQQYVELVSGLGHVPLTPDQGTPSRLEFYQNAMVYRQLEQPIEMALQLASAAGSGRLSPGAMQRFLHDQQTTAQVTYVPVSSDRYLSKVDEPGEEAMRSLFDRHKDDLPGTGEPLGFGYRYPDRVKVEYLTVSFDRVYQATRVDEADALDYYDSHPDEFATMGSMPADFGIEAELEAPAGPAMPYVEVRSQIIDKLRNEKAEKTVTRVIKAAQAVLLDDLRKRTDDQGDGTERLSLTELADRLQERFGVLAEVHRRDDTWLNRVELSRLPGIGTSALLSPRRLLFVNYALGVGPLLTEKSPALLVSLKLEVGAPSMPVQSFDGSRHLFRIIAADKAHSPASIDEVRDRVFKDARIEAAYRLLKEEADIWVARAKEEGLDSIAAQLGSEPVAPPAFPKRMMLQTGNQSVPFIDGVGRDQSFMDAVFGLVDKLVAAADLGMIPEPARLVGVLVDKQRALMITRLDDATPMSRSAYERQAQAPKFSTLIDQSFRMGAQDPLSIQSLASRAGFTFAAGELEESQSEDTDDEDEAQETTTEAAQVGDGDESEAVEVGVNDEG